MKLKFRRDYNESDDGAEWLKRVRWLLILFAPRQISRWDLGPTCLLGSGSSQLKGVCV